MYMKKRVLATVLRSSSHQVIIANGMYLSEKSQNIPQNTVQFTFWTVHSS